MNDLILDFFMITGMKECFDKFSEEINYSGMLFSSDLQFKFHIILIILK